MAYVSLLIGNKGFLHSFFVANFEACVSCREPWLFLLNSAEYHMTSDTKNGGKSRRFNAFLNAPIQLEFTSPSWLCGSHVGWKSSRNNFDNLCYNSCDLLMRIILA